METTQPLSLLGGLSAAQFMRRHWQKKPLLVRQAVPAMAAPITRSALFELAARDDVESRLIRHAAKGWTLRHGPLPRRALPPATQPGWTLLVQGVDTHDDNVHALLQQFRFVPDARLDDLMISYASDGGGVGAHFDSYDVFLLQASGRRRWSIGRQRDLTLQQDVPLKILQHFVPEQSFVLEAGDMLYLPPRYRDPAQPAVETPAAMPAALQAFARQAVLAGLRDPDAIDRALGESMTEPKSNVWFENSEAGDISRGVALDRRSRMLYDARHLYINGESFRAAGRDATLMRRLADQRGLAARELVRASDEALALLEDWCEAGWLHAAA